MFGRTTHTLGKKARLHGALLIILGLIAGVTVAAGATVTQPSGDAEALDVVEFASVYGKWSDVKGKNGGTPPCGVAYFKAPNSTDPQEDSPTAQNVARFGDPSNNPCTTIDKRSGFGFLGRDISSAPTSANTFLVGTFTHFNNPIEGTGDNVGTGKLTATFKFKDATTSPSTDKTLAVVYNVTLDETPNNDTNCPYGNASDPLLPGPNGSGLNTAGCADAVTIALPSTATSIQVGETSLNFEIKSSSVLTSGTCPATPPANAVQGNKLVTAEGGARNLCVYGGVTAGKIIIEKSINGGGDANFDFTIQERSQRPGTSVKGNAIGAATTKTVNVTEAVPNPDKVEVSLEAGVYSLEEVLQPAIPFSSLTCTSVGGDGKATLASPFGTYTAPAHGAVIDLDSGETITCQYTNDRLTELTIVKDAEPNSAQAFGFTTTSPAASNHKLPATFSLTDNGGANSQKFLIDAGTFTVTENNLEPNWDLTSISCTGGNTSTNVAAGTLTVNSSLGQKITCTFNNRKIPTPALNVTKTATPLEFQEPAGTVVYGVTIANPNGATDPVTITAITDTVSINGATATTVNLNNGAPFAVPGGNVTANTCAGKVGTTVGATPVTCSFTVSYTGRNSGDKIADTVKVDGKDPFNQSVSGSDDENVDVTNRVPVIRVDKQNPVGQNTIVAPGGPATWTITVYNDAIAPNGEPLTITAITDQLSKNGSHFGSALDITSLPPVSPVTATTCGTLIGTTLVPGASKTCEITVDTAKIGSLTVGDRLTNFVEVTGRDDDPTPTVVKDDDTASKDVVATAPQLGVTKSDADATITEPGASITYNVRINNLGAVGASNPIRIDTITDTVYFAPRGGTEAAVGTITITGSPAASAPAVGGVVGQVSPSAGAAPVNVTLVGTTCTGLIGTVLAPAAGADCTITLSLPGNAADGYRDVVRVDGTEMNTTPANPVNASDDEATPVVNANPAVQVVKTASPTSVPETGGNVTFSFAITNTSAASTDPITLTELSDSVYGNLLTANAASSCDELSGAVLAKGETVSCSFTAFVSGTVATSHTNVVTATAKDDENNPATDTGNAEVKFTDNLPKISVTKTANPTSVPESGGDVTYTLVVENETAEPVTLTKLIDDKFGDVTVLATNTCTLPQTLAAADSTDGSGPDSYTCTFTVRLAQQAAETSHTNVVTATANDDEGNTATDTDDETVTFTLIPPSVDITKTDVTASPGISEPGGHATYELTIVNTSYEQVTITSLTDTINYAKPASTVGPFSILDIAGVNASPTKAAPLVSSTCVTKALAAYDGAAGGTDTYTCRFTLYLEGTAQDVADTAIVVVTDNDGQTGTDSADAETPIVDVPPVVEIVKTASPTRIEPGDEVTYTFTIFNRSTIEDLKIVSLTDSVFTFAASECIGVVGTWLTPDDGNDASGSDQVTCSIERFPAATPAGAASFDHVNVATVTGGDDEIIDSQQNPDNQLPYVTDTDDATVQMRKQGSITVRKVATPPGQEFTFNLTGRPSQSTKPTAEAPTVYPDVVFSGLDAGDFDLTESLPSGWQLSPVTCTLGNATFDVEAIDNGVGIELGWGEDVICTFTNTKLGDMTVAKTVTAGPTRRAGTNLFDLTYQIVVTNGSYTNETFELNDVFLNAASVAIDSIGTITKPAGVAVNGAWNGEDVTALTDGPQPIAGNSSVTITIPVVFEMAATATASDRDCRLVGDETTTGSLNRVDLDPSIGANSSDTACAEFPDPDISVAKTARASQPVAVDGDTFTVTYDIAVTNAGPGQSTYTLTDTPDFGAGATITAITVTKPDTSTMTLPVAGGTIVTNDPINGGATETYAVQVTFDVAATMTGAERVCNVAATPGEGTFNSATITFPGGTDIDNDCVDIPNPTISVAKTVVGDPAQPVRVAGGFQYTVSYVVAVSNTGAAPGTYDLADVATFGSGTTINSTVVSSAQLTTSPVTNPTNPIVDDKPIAPGATHTYDVTITFTVAATTTADARDCELGEGENGTGTLNTATVTPSIGATSSDDDCVAIPAPEITTAKTVTSAPTYDATSGAYTIKYRVDVVNGGDGLGTFTLVDTPSFGDGVTITSIAATSSDFTVDEDFDAAGDTIVADEPIAAGDTKSAEITVTFTVDADTTAEARDCELGEGENGTGTLNTVTVTPNIGEPDTGQDCGTIPNPGIGITKTVVGDPAQPVQVPGGFQYTVSYVVAVSNTGAAPGTYDLADVPAFGSGTTIDEVQVASVQLATSPVTDPTNPIVEDEPIAPGATHTYDVTITFTVAATTTADARDCNVGEGENGTGTLNTATVTPSIGATSSDDDCVAIPDPEITTAKTVTSAPAYDAATGAYTIKYRVDVVNGGDGPGTFTLVDTPSFGDGVTITSIAATSSDFTVDEDFDAAGDTIVADEPIAAGDTKSAEITVTFTVDADTTAEARDCELGEGENGTGTLNTVTVTPNIGEPDTGQDCGTIPNPGIGITKTVVGDPAPTTPGSLSWTVEYEIEVLNSGDGPGTYDLDDVPGFPSGVTVTGHVATSSDITVDPAFNTDVTESRIATGVEIPAETTHTVTVVVTFDYTGAVDPGDRVCGEEPATGSGAYNSATVTPNIGESADDDACVDLPDPDVSITKTVTSAPAANADGTFSVAYRIDVTNAAAAGTGSYDLVDDPQFSQGVNVVSKSVTNSVPGGITVEETFDETGHIVTDQAIASGTTHSYVVTVVFSTNFTPETTYQACDDDGVEGGRGLYNSATVTVDGTDTDAETCVDLPGDLMIEKDDHGVTAIAGGAPFTYTLTVTNVGGIATGEPVTVTDVLPDGLTWVEFPDSCVQAGQTLTCTIDAALVARGGMSTSFDVSAKAPAGTAPNADGYQNLSYVDSPLDPAPESPECPIDEEAPRLVDFGVAAAIDAFVAQALEALLPNPANNVGCDTTPVIDGKIEVTKTDSISDGASVVTGQEFTYTLNVKNTGSSPVDTITLADDLPANIELVSVAAGAGWTCNAADPVACSNPGPLAPGATTTDVVLTVRVGAAFTGAQIDNKVTSTAVVRTDGEPGDSKTVTDDDTETTPFNPAADLAIVKTASADVVDQGQPVSFTLTVTNKGPNVATDVLVKDAVPAELTVTAVTSGDFTCPWTTGNAVTCTRASLAVGASATITVTAVVNVGVVGTVSNTATVSGHQPDPDPSNNTYTDSVVVPAVVVNPPEPPPVTLPSTGSNINSIITIAVTFLLGGFALVLSTLKRRRRTI